MCATTTVILGYHATIAHTTPEQVSYIRFRSRAGPELKSTHPSINRIIKQGLVQHNARNKANATNTISNGRLESDTRRHGIRPVSDDLSFHLELFLALHYWSRSLGNLKNSIHALRIFSCIIFVFAFDPRNVSRKDANAVDSKPLD